YVSDATGVHAITLDRVLVHGANVRALHDTRCSTRTAEGLPTGALECAGDTPIVVRIAATGLAFEGFVWLSGAGERVHSQTIPYAALGRLLRAPGPLSSVPGALEHVAADTPLSRLAVPPQLPPIVSLLGDPSGLDALLWRYATQPAA